MLGRVPQILKVKPDQPEPELQTYGYPNTFNNLQAMETCTFTETRVLKPNHIEMAFNYVHF